MLISSGMIVLYPKNGFRYGANIKQWVILHYLADFGRLGLMKFPFALAKSYIVETERLYLRFLGSVGINGLPDRLWQKIMIPCGI